MAKALSPAAVVAIWRLLYQRYRSGGGDIVADSVFLIMVFLGKVGHVERMHQLRGASLIEVMLNWYSNTMMALVQSVPKPDFPYIKGVRL